MRFVASLRERKAADASTANGRNSLQTNLRLCVCSGIVQSPAHLTHSYQGISLIVSNGS